MAEPRRTAVVTGASRGIGAACARALARQGCNVVLAARSAEHLEQVAMEITGEGGTAHVVTADMESIGDLDRLAKEAERRFGGIDILVNNAGIHQGEKEIYDVTPDEWDHSFDVMLKAPWYLSKCVYASLKSRGGGSIINMSSVSGLRHNVGELTYTLPKASLIMLTKICAKEWARDNIRVNCIAPGWVRTDMAGSFLAQVKPDVRINMLNIISEPDDIAGLVVYLVSHNARAVTGETIRIDAGAFGLF